MAEIVDRITLGSNHVMIMLTASACDREATNTVEIAWSPRTMHRGREVIKPADDASNSTRPIKAEARSKLLCGISLARAWLDDIVSGRSEGIEAIAQHESISERAARMNLSLAFIAPDIVEAAVDGTLPRGFGLSRLTDLPLSWTEQRQKLGLTARV